MSIFSFFNIKSKLKEAFSSEKISSLLELIKTEIIEQVKSELDGEEKKTIVDNAVIAFIKENFTTNNVFVNVIINALIDYIPTITQYIYNYLKKYVDGLTEV